MTRKNRKLVAVASISLVLHLVWVVVFSYLIWAGPFEHGVSREVSWFATVCPSCGLHADAVYTASQMGRLDLLALSLTVLATVLALGAFGGFFLVRSAAMEAAADETSKKLPELIDSQKIADVIVKDEAVRLNLADIVRRKIYELDEGPTDDEANRMAKEWSAWEEGSND